MHRSTRRVPRLAGAPRRRRGWPPRILTLARAGAVAASLAGCGDGHGTVPKEVPAPAFPADLPRPAFDVARIEVGGRPVDVELADDAPRRAYGLMFVETLTDDRGMLFIYPQSRELGFWMRNTRIPLDLVFFDESGRILTLHREMEPFREHPSYSSRVPCRFALELPGGWFARHGLDETASIWLPHAVLTRQASAAEMNENIPRRLGP